MTMKQAEKDTEKLPARGPQAAKDGAASGGTTETTRKQAAAQRTRAIVRASYVGVIGNVLLSGFKFAVGFAANSIAIILDAVNNATDVLSSVITIIGTKLANRRPNPMHPFGFGRVEYMTSLVIGVIILVAGGISLDESVDKVLKPAETNYTAVTLTVIIASIVAKIFIGWFLTRRGRALDSGALEASGLDSNYDAVLTGGTLVAALAMMIWKVNIDGLIGLVISFFVLKAGFDVLKDAVEPIIGTRGSESHGCEIKRFISSFPNVLGTYDLLLDNFGPNEAVGSARIEVDDTMTARQIHELTRDISEAVYGKFGVVIVLGIYASNTSGAYAAMREKLDGIAKARDDVIETHGFYVDEQNGEVTFDLVTDFKADGDAVRRRVVEAMSEAFPKYAYNVVVDRDYLD